MKVFVVTKNADLIEGRGPMIIDSIWLDEEEANEYAANQKGVMGRPNRYFNTVRKAWETTGDWEVTEFTVKK